MNEMSDRTFMDYIDAIEREVSPTGDALPGDLAAEPASPPDAAPDDRAALDVARRLLAGRRPLPERLASPEWIRAQAGDAEIEGSARSAGSLGSPESTPAASPHTDLAAPVAASPGWWRASNRPLRPRWLPEAAVAALILALGLLAVQWLPATREDSGDRTSPTRPALDGLAPAYPPPGFAGVSVQSPQRSLDDPDALLRLLGQVGGVLKHGAEASDGRLYLGAGPRLLVVDLAAEADAEGESGERGSGLTAEVVTGQTGRLDGMIEDLVVGEGYVYAWEGPPSNGLRVIDVRDDAAPVPVGFTRAEITNPARSAALALDGTVVWVALDFGGVAELFGFDVTDPAQPRQVGSTGLLGTDMAPTGALLNLAIAGGYAFVAGARSPLQIIDVRTPAAPEGVVAMDSLDRVARLWVDDRTLYVVHNDSEGDPERYTLIALDVSAPEAPREIGRLPLDDVDSVLDLLVDDGHAFLLTYDRASADRMVGGGKALRVIDVSQPEAPREVAVVEGDDVGAGAVALAKSGDDVFVVHDTGRAWNIDVSRPEHPSHDRGWGQDRSVGGAFDRVTVAEVDGLRAVMASRPGEQITLDLGDPAAPKATGYSGGSHDLDAGGGIVMIDGEPTGPSFAWQSAFSNREWDGNNPTWDHLILTVEDARYDPRRGYDHEQWFPISSFDISSVGPPVDVQIHDHWLYVLGERSLTTYRIDRDTSRPASGLVMDGGYLSTPGSIPAWPTPDPATFGRFEPFTVAMGMAIAPPYAYVADGYGGLGVLDIADPASPREITALPFVASQARAIARVADFLLLVDATPRLSIVSIADPAQPRHLATADLSRAAIAAPETYAPYAIAFRDGLAYVAGGGALRVVDVGGPHQPREIEHFILPGTPRHLALDGDRLYVASGTGGLWIFEMPERDWATWTPGAPAAATVAATVTEPPTALPGGVSDDTTSATPTPGPTLDPAVSAPALDESVIGRVGGSGKTRTNADTVIAVAEGTAFIAARRDLAILDVSDPSTLRGIGEYHLPPDPDPFMAMRDSDDAIVAIEVHAGLVYMLDPRGILHVVDVADPARPRAAGSPVPVFGDQGSGWTNARSMHRVGSSLYVAGGHVAGGGPGPARENLAAVLDLRDPARPKPGPPWIVPPDDMLDASYRRNPQPVVIGPPGGNGPALLIEPRRVERDRVTVLTTTDGVRASGAAILDLDRNVITAATDGRYAYLFAYAFANSEGKVSIVVLDLSDPAAPRQVNEVPYPGFDEVERAWPRAVRIASGRLYVAETVSSSQVLDNSSRLEFWPFGHSTGPISGRSPMLRSLVIPDVPGDAARFESVPVEVALRTYSLVDPTTPHEVGYLSTGLAPGVFIRSLAIDGDIAYLSGPGGRLATVDVSRPDQPRLINVQSDIGWVGE